jgi:hypothetical protein
VAENSAARRGEKISRPRTLEEKEEVKILFTIPHYFEAGGKGARNYGSVGKTPEPRVGALALTISALWQAFGPRQFSLNHASRKGLPANGQFRNQIAVCVCTTGARHLLGRLDHLKDRFTPVRTQAEPPLLGYECHRVLKENLGRVDYYCYLEDDLVLRDPLFFQKLAWFNAMAEDGALLLPNRYEYAVTGGIHKVYIDGEMRPRASKDFQDPTDRTILTGKALGMPIRLARTWNPHSGCFFLTEKQMTHWAAQDYFLDRSTAFIGPPESAATLGIMKAFRIYKPALPNAGFLEIEHCGTSYLRLLGTQVPIEAAPKPSPPAADQVA